MAGTGVAAAAMGVVPRAAAAPTEASTSQNCGVRYLGYQAADRSKPYARYMRDHTDPAPAVVQAAFAGAPLAASAIPDFSGITRDLEPTGYSRIETGYGQQADGVLFVAVRTVMPRVTAAMWDWWFGWHSIESSRYKLWHPDAHEYASLQVDRTTASIPDKQKYIGNISFVDELVGPKLQQLGIAFRDPRSQGFTVPSDQTLIFGRVGSSIAPVDLGWLAHQVRPIAGGAEMRSRFYLNLRGLHVPDVGQAVCAVKRGAAVDPSDLFLGLDLAKNLLMHCGQEMNHLAGFLPELHQEFSRGSVGWSGDLEARRVMRRPTPDTPGPGQESVWDYPRPPRLETFAGSITIELGGEIIASATRGWRVLETSHPPTYYIPQDAFADGVLRETAGASWCEWKGEASYFDLVTGERGAPRAAWTYLDPTPGFVDLRGAIAVMATQVDRATVNGEEVTPQPGGFYGGWVTSSVVGPFKGIPGSMGW